MSARSTKCTKTVNEDSGSIVFEFASGQVVTVTLNELPADIQSKLALYGLGQKLGDAYASSDSPSTAYAMFDAVLKRLVAGEWKKQREGGGGPRIGQLAEALATATGKSVEEAASVVAGMDETQKSDLRKHPKVAAVLADLRAKAAAAKAKEAKKAAGEGDELDLSALMG